MTKRADPTHNSSDGENGVMGLVGVVLAAVAANNGWEPESTVVIGTAGLGLLGFLISTFRR